MWGCPLEWERVWQERVRMACKCYLVYHKCWDIDLNHCGILPVAGSVNWCTTDVGILDWILAGFCCCWKPRLFFLLAFVLICVCFGWKEMFPLFWSGSWWSGSFFYARVCSGIYQLLMVWPSNLKACVQLCTVGISKRGHVLIYHWLLFHNSRWAWRMLEG